MGKWERGLIKKILDNEILDKKKKGIVNLKFVDDKEMRRLNQKFRKIDRTTDVLSFSMQEEGILGDIAISLDTAKRNAERYRVKVQNEIKRLIVHGTLHLLGFNHGSLMREKEEIYQEV